ncbi:MAG TPA: hypothetical protein VIQ00_12385 [Chitinophagaceae bacterium]|jgi:hypothetical protein
MQELIERLKKQANLDDTQAQKTLQVIVDFIGEKFPMLKGQISNLLGAHNEGNDAPQVGGIDTTGLG